MKWLWRLLCISLFLAFSSYSALAQQTLSTITGVVVDSAGSAVPGAEVTVKNLDTNIEKRLSSNDTGLYEAPYLIPGHYQVAVGKAGFKQFVAADILVQAGQIVRIDAKLEIGEVTTQVTVHDVAPAITTEASNLTSLRDNRQLEDAPLNTRGQWDSFLFTFVGMMPGAQPSDASFDTAFNGTRPYENQFSVDGIVTTSTLYGNIIGPANPSMEAVQEIKVDSNSNAAEFQAAGAVNVITRSGSNRLHGSAYEYYTTSGFDARDPFLPSVSRNLLNNFGASLGGPIRKNHTFFFADYEQFANYYGTPESVVVPTPAMRGGNFSQVGTPITNPYTGQPFTGNIIPTGMLNATALKMQTLFYPTATNPTNVLAGPNFAESLDADQEKEMFDVRIDHQVSTKNSFYGRFDYARMPNHGRDSPLPTIPKRAQVRNTRSFILSDTNAFTPTVINEFRIGLNRGHNNYHDPISGSQVVSELGLTGLANIGSDVYGVPTIGISGFQGISTLSGSNNLEQTYQMQDSVTWQKGRHTIKFGGEVLKNFADLQFTSPSQLMGTTNFTGVFTGYGYADFLLGLPLNASIVGGGTSREYTSNYQFSIYAQDSYHLTNRLTLNYGLRWDADEPYTEKDERSYNFDPVKSQVVIPSQQTSAYLFQPFVQAGIAPIVAASQAGVPTALVNANRKNFAPRIGFAYLLTSDKKTVLRGGYGIYFERSTDATWMAMQAGAPFNGTLNNPKNEIINGTPTWQLPALFPTVYSAQTGSDFSAYNPNMQEPYVQQWNLTVERQLSPSTGLRVSYIATKGTRLIWNHDLNMLHTSNIPYSPLNKPFPTLGSIVYVDNGANSIYNGLEVTLTRKWKSGLMYESTYTLANNITDNDNGWQGGAEATYSYNREYDRGPVSWTRRQRMANSLFWELPFGNGKRFLQNSKGLNRLVGGWQYSLVNILQTGDHFTPEINTTYDMGNINNYSGRPDRLKNGNLSGGQRSINQWFATSLGTPGAAWGYPPSSRIGNAGFDILTGPGTINLDMGLFKTFQVRERMRLQIQMTATNALNHPNPADPDNYVTDTTAGVVSDVQSWEGAKSRTLQLGAKLTW